LRVLNAASGIARCAAAACGKNPRTRTVLDPGNAQIQIFGSNGTELLPAHSGPGTLGVLLHIPLPTVTAPGSSDRQLRAAPQP
jgi:hypothetical protein